MSTQLLPTVRMPQLSGGRERARTLTAPLVGQMRNQTVRLDCRQLVAVTVSFADQIVLEVLVDGGADQLVVEHADGEFPGYLLDAAKDHGVQEKLTII